jgi:hypothetical protein
MHYILTILILLNSLLSFAQQVSSLMVYKNDSSFYSKGRLKIPTRLIVSLSFNDGLYPITIIDTSKGFAWNRTGFLNAKGKMQIPCTYDSLYSAFNKGIAVVGTETTYNKTGVRRRRMRARMLAGVINTENKIIIPLNFRAIDSLQYGLIPVQNFNLQWGFFNIKGEKITDCLYDNYCIIDSNEIVLVRQGKYSIMNYTGTMLLKDYKSITGADSVFYTSSFKTIIVKTLKDSTLFTTMADSISSYTVGRLHYFSNYYTGSINLKGEIKKDSWYEFKTTSYSPANNIADNKVISFFTDTIHYPFVKRFDRVYPFVEGYAIILKNGKYGFVDTLGNVQVSPQYTACKNYSEGLAGIIIKGKWGYIDKDEKIKVQPYYTDVTYFRGGVAAVKTVNKWYLINTEGKELNKIHYDTITPAPGDKWYIGKNGQWGLADKTGTEILVPRYQHIIDTGYDYYIIQLNGKYGVVDKNQNFVIPLQYEGGSYDPINKLFLMVLVNGSQETIIAKPLSSPDAKK